MPTQVVPFVGFDQVGVNLDTPPVALPPQAISDARNVRFKDGAVRKMEGEVNIFPNLFDDGELSYDGTILKYVAWWPNPNIIDSNRGYYLIIREEVDMDGNFVDVAYLVLPGTSGAVGELVEKGRFLRDENANWQHTFFQGGFALIINNGLEAPHYIIDQDGNEDINAVPNFAPLPGWESYNIQRTVISDTFVAGNTTAFNAGIIDINEVNIVISRLRNGVSTVVTVNSMSGAGGDVFGRYYDTDGNVNADNAPQDVGFFFRLDQDLSGEATLRFNATADDGTELVTILPGDLLTVSIESVNPVNVTAGVIRAYGDLLVAGNLVERDPLTDNTIVRNLAGVVRASDVAAPGDIPTNWNPFAGGVSTADEFVITSTGVVQDLVELQGNLFIYSNSSIAVMRQTGNPQVPLAVTPVTDSYGAQTTEAVREFDGKHFVIGTQDIYLFGGHPGSIQSISDQRIRRYFFDNLNPLHNQRLFTLRYSQRDEIWICYPTTASLQGECDEALIWNYRQNVWTIRTLTSAVAGDIGPVPGGGLPTSNNIFANHTGTRQVIQDGIPTAHNIRFPPSNPQIQRIHGGVATSYDIDVDNIPNFDSSASSFIITFDENFDSGPTYDHEDPDDRVHFDTRAANFTIRLLETSATDASVTLDLPRFLTTDKEWDAERVYFAGRGGPIDPDYYPGQRVIRGGNVYRVRNGFGGGTTPSRMYDPNAQGPFYRLDDPVIYHDTQDIVGVFPEDLVLGAPFGMVPGDGGTGNNITAVQARWDLLGPVSSHGWGVDDVAREFLEHVNANADFSRYFISRDDDVTDGSVVVEARASSGTGTFPTYEGIATVFDFPMLDSIPGSMQPLPNGTNGGNINAESLPNPLTDIDQFGALVLTFTTRERSYIPFNASDITGTGIYSNSPDDTILDRVTVAFNGNFSMDDGPLDIRVSDMIREAFNIDPTAFWEDNPNSSDPFSIRSTGSGNYTLELSVVAPQGIMITNDNFDLTVTPGSRATDGTAFAIPPDGPYFEVVPPDNQATVYAQPVTVLTTDDSDMLMEDIFQDVVMTHDNWAVTLDTNTGQTVLTTAASSNLNLPASLREEDRPVEGIWTVRKITGGNSLVMGGAVLEATSSEVEAGQFSISTTPTYLGVLVSNPATMSGFEFLVIDAGDDSPLSTAEAIAKWFPQIRNAIPRISLIRRGNGFFLQPANYDSLANFVLDVRINDTPANANWIYQLATFGREVDELGATIREGITLNPGSDIPLAINGAEEDNVFNFDAIPNRSAPEYLRSGGPLKVHQFISGGVSTLAPMVHTGQTTLIFDIFRPWPRDEVNQNLEYPIFATVFLRQDEGGIYRRLNKVTGADIGWSRPSYEFAARTTTTDEANFREVIGMGDDFPVAYESYFERVQLALQPEFDTEQLQSIALWADGTTPAFLRGADMSNRLNVKVDATMYPGQMTDLSDPASVVSNNFNVNNDYKVDLRLHGRFINYRISDNNTVPMPETDFSNQAEWRVSGMQADIRKGGTR